MKRKIFYGTALAFLIVITSAVGLSVSSIMQQQDLLAQSVQNQLVAICNAAREMIDADELITYKSNEDAANNEKYQQTLSELRKFSKSVGADYIYVLRYIDGTAQFVFDTDEENPEVFIPYELSPVHERAFAGESGADIMNVQDEYGSFNTAAVPIMESGKVIAVVSTDIRDTFLTEGKASMKRNVMLLIGVLVVAMLSVFLVINRMLGRLEKMQHELERMAHFDTVTGLPNRQYLFSYLKQLSANQKEPYAIIFIDLDNFKRTNDTAGHDEGDALLRYVAKYIDDFGKAEHAVSFRPVAGKLNIAARVGGDEFIQVISGVSSEEQALALGNKLLEGFFKQEDNRFVQKFDVGMSIGVALCPSHTEDYNTLIKYADVAMYQAKRAGKNRVCIYNDAMKSTEEKE